MAFVQGNRSLMRLAVIGVLLYALVIVLNALSGGGSSDGEMGQPAVSKEAAVQSARDWAAGKFPELAHAQASIVYDSNKPASAYIGKNGLEAAYAKKLAGSAPLDYWQVKLAGASGRPELTVQLSMEKAAVTGWRFDAGSAAGRNEAADRPAADRALAEAGYNPADFTYAPSAASTVSGKTPNAFRYVSKTEGVGEAKLTVTVEMQNGKAVGFLPDLQLPSSFTAWLGDQDKAAARMSLISLLLTAAMGIAALVYAIRNRRDVIWSRGVWFVVIFFALYAVQTVNGLPGALTQADSLSAGASGTVYKAAYVIFTLGVVFLLAVAQYFFGTAGDQLWRSRGWNPWPRWREAAFGEKVFSAMGRGYLICLFLIGVQQLLFFAAEKAFGTFGIGDPTQSVDNVYVPSIYPLLAWMAGTSEEVAYRLFGIAVFLRLVRVRFLAVLLPSIIWALGHTGYAIYPSYTRLIEVTVLGLIFGWVFLKYGLFTAIFTHVCMDSILASFSLATSAGTAGAWMAGVLFMVLPALAAYLILFLHRQSRGRPPASGGGAFSPRFPDPDTQR